MMYLILVSIPMIILSLGLYYEYKKKQKKRYLKSYTHLFERPEDAV